MILSKVRQLKFEKEERDGRKWTYEALTEATGLAATTLALLLGREPIKRIDGNTLDALCAFFGCGVGDLLEYVPSGGKGKEQNDERSE